MDYTALTIDEFLACIASENVTPAGGTGAAVVGAIGASLCEMVCIHTVENDEYAGVEADVDHLRTELRKQREHLLTLAQSDADVVDELFSSADGEMSQSEIKRSIGVPLTIATACQNVIELAIEVTAKGNRNAVPDAGTGVILAQAAFQASVFTVRSNIEHVTDPAFIDEVEQRLATIEVQTSNAHEQVMQHMEERT